MSRGQLAIGWRDDPTSGMNKAPPTHLYKCGLLLNMNKSKRSKKSSRAAKRPQRKQNAMTTISRGLADVANRFVPGSGPVLRGVSRLLGFGAYTREGAETFLASKVPAMHATLDKGIRVSHHEYLGEVNSSVLFTLLTYPINPGMAVTFPWLSTVASAFQKWEDNGIVFYFKSTSASALNSTNTALGSMIGAVTYNPYQNAPTDKIAMLGLSGATAGKPAEDNLFPVECKTAQSLFATKLVRITGVTDDLAKYDSGNFHFASVGAQAAAAVGELHVVYDITLKEPKLAQSGWVSTLYLAGTIAGASPLGTQAATTPTVNTNPLGCGVDYANHRLSIPAGACLADHVYRFRWYVYGTAAAVTHPMVGFVNMVTKNGPLTATDAAAAAPTNGANTATMMYEVFLTVTNPAVVSYVTFGVAGTLPTNVTKGSLTFEEIGRWN